MWKWLNALDRRRQRAKAMKALASVRDGFYWRRMDLDAHLANAGLSLEDIGSSEEEMVRLWRESERSGLRLDWTRIQILAKRGPVDWDIDQLQERLETAQLSLGDLDPALDNDRLESERVRGWRNEAVRQLEMLRGNVPQDQDFPARHAPLLREALVKAGLSPEDIDTSNEEIDWVESGERLPFTPTG